MAIAEFLAENFHSVANLTWGLSGNKATARFAVDDVQVEVRFEERAIGEWLVSFDTKTSPAAKEDYHRAFYVFNGVFQAVEEFIAVRTPDRLIFSTKREGLASIYETYLRREQSRIAEFGYQLLDAQRIPPYTEYVLERIGPSSWKSN